MQFAMQFWYCKKCNVRAIVISMAVGLDTCTNTFLFLQKKTNPFSWNRCIIFMTQLPLLTSFENFVRSFPRSEWFGLTPLYVLNNSIHLTIERYFFVHCTIMVMDRQRTLQNARPSCLPGSDFLCNTFPKKKKKSSPPANTLSPVNTDTTHIQTVALDELPCHVNINNTIERFTPLDGVTPNDNF